MNDNLLPTHGGPEPALPHPALPRAPHTEPRACAAAQASPEPPAPPSPATQSWALAEDTWAAPLLASDRGGAELGARRLAFGTLGVACLQAAHTSFLPDLALSQRLWAPVGLVLAAATGLVLSLPGALILLTSLGAAPSWHKAYEGLGRAFFLGGLLSAGFAPLVALFAWTGAGPGLLTGLTFLAYATAGLAALTRLTRELSAARRTQTLGGLLVLAGFWSFSLFVGAYTWFRLMEGMFG